MKKCPKCGLTFDDQTNFCPACGERLVKEEPKCPSCGAPISEGDKFCKNCGARLEAAPKAEEPQKVEETPKEEPKPEPVKEEPAPVVVPVPVEEEPVEEEAPLEEQPVEEQPVEESNKEEKVEEVPSPVEETPKEETKPNKGVLIANMIAAGLCLLAALFLIIGMFGPVFSLTASYGGTYQHTTYGFKYLLKDGPEQLRQIREAGFPRSSYYSYCVSQFALECVLFFGGLAGCLACTIVGIVKNIMALTKKQEANIDVLVTAGSLRLLIILFCYAKYANKASAAGYFIKYDFGWGGGLIIAGLAVCLTAAIGKMIFGAISKKDGIPSAIVRSVVSIAIFALVFSIFSPLTKIIGSNGYYTETLSVNGYTFAETALQAYSQSSSGELQTQIFIPGIISLYFAFAGMILMFTAFKKALDQKSKAAPIVNAAVALFFLILSAGLSLSATLAYAEYAGMLSGYAFTFASGPIAGIVLTIVIVVPGLIVSNVLNKSKE